MALLAWVRRHHVEPCGPGQLVGVTPATLPVRASVLRYSSLSSALEGPSPSAGAGGHRQSLSSPAPAHGRPLALAAGPIPPKASSTGHPAAAPSAACLQPSEDVGELHRRCRSAAEVCAAGIAPGVELAGDVAQCLGRIGRLRSKLLHRGANGRLGLVALASTWSRAWATPSRAFSTFADSAIATLPSAVIRIRIRRPGQPCFSVLPLVDFPAPPYRLASPPARQRCPGQRLRLMPISPGGIPCCQSRPPGAPLPH